MKRLELFFGLLRVPLDFFLTFLALILAYKTRPLLNLPTDLATFPAWENYRTLVSYGSLLFILVLWSNRMYSFKTTARLSSELKQAFKASLLWLMLIIVYYFIIRDFPFSRLALGMGWIFTFVLVCLGRSLIKLIQFLLLKKGIGQRRLLFIGNNAISQSLYQIFKKNPNYQIIGTLDKNSPTPNRLKKDPPVIGTLNELETLVKKHQIEEIIQTQSDMSEALAAKILDFCRVNHLQYHFVPDLIEVHRTNIEISTFSGIPVITLKPTPLDGWGKIAKRGFDLIISFCSLLILSPLFLIIALLIKKDSKGPVFFTHLDDGTPARRVGQYGRLFTCLKFRTMQDKTHNLRYTELAERNIRKGGPLVKIKQDPRVTKFGQLLRKTSLDELAQLFNVFIGEMSLVGPRPHLPEEVAKYQKHHRFVLEIKPGITGLAQISGRSDLDFEQEVQLDTYYIQNWSLWLDLKIIFKTFSILFQKYEE